MRFGFNAISDDAKGKLESLGIKWFEKDGFWIVETEAYDKHEEEWREKRPNYEFREDIPRELHKEWAAQGTRIWKNPDTGHYFYLIHDCVFTMQPRLHTDHRFNPPTVEEISYFDLVNKDDQDRYRDILIQRPANADTVGGGVLI